MYFSTCTTLNDLKASYHKLALANHPDLGGSTEKMKVINAEYEKAFEHLKTLHNAGKAPEQQTTEVPEEFINIVYNLFRLDGLIIELCGCWIWITGNTKEHKEQLKDLGCKWHAKKCAWSWHHAEDSSCWYRGKNTLQDIRAKYGSQILTAANDYKRIGATA